MKKKHNPCDGEEEASLLGASVVSNFLKWEREKEKGCLFMTEEEVGKESSKEKRKYLHSQCLSQSRVERQKEGWIDREKKVSVLSSLSSG